MDISSLIEQALAALALVSDGERLLRVEVPSTALVAERLHGYEAVCAPFRFEVECFSVSAFVPLPDLLEQPVRLQLRQADNSLRRWHGYCSEAMALGSDGGLARYRLIVEPWTRLLTLRRNALIFQDLDALGVVGRVFSHYSSLADYRFEVSRALPVRAITTQYRESDWAFVTRLLSEAGLLWRYEHAQEGDGGHTLVIYDAQAVAPEAGPIRFHRIDATEDRDAIGAFVERYEVVPSVSVSGSWQSEQVATISGRSEAEAGHVPLLEVFVQPRDGRFATADQARLEAEYRLDGLRTPRALYSGAGSARNLAAGSSFALTQHDRYGGRSFVPLAIRHVAVNNLGSGIVELLGAPDLERGSYRNRFVATPAETTLASLSRPRALAPGPMLATVVGLPGTAVTPNREHQVRVQFSWQRGESPNRGGLSVEAGHAPGDQRSGTWVPVLERVAGPNWGGHFLPRLGSEVLVEFMHGDLDQPRVVGQLYNGEVSPPFGGGIDGPSNHPGTLSGVHTQSHDGGGTQQWVLDDTPSQVRTRLHTTLGDSRLELGYLIEHGDRDRGGLRGRGFELATQGWGNVHAREGLLVSTTRREDACSTQLDIQEAVSQLRGAERTAQRLHETLMQQQVPGLEANARQRALREALDPSEAGRYGDRYKPAPGSREASDQPVERFADAKLVAESPDRIGLSTPGSGVAYAGGDLHVTVQEEAQVTAGQTLSAVTGAHGALYAHAGPLRIIAANGPVTLQSHTGELEVLADRTVTVTATEDRIDVLAREKIVLQAGDSQVVLEGGDITFITPGEFIVKASQQPFTGPDSGNASTSLPDGLVHLEPRRMLDFSG